jgi:NitT/TauT family transport system ATP-binding protein
MSGPIHIEIQGLAKSYVVNREELAALAPVSLTVARGEFLAIVGPSGCGKSTLLKILLGVVPPSAGRIVIGGREASGPQPNCGIVFQAPVLPPWRRVLDNVMLPIEVLGLRRADHVVKARELLSLAGLDGFERHYPHELSGGMQQRVALCRALIHEPELLLMDEPFGALDALTRETMQTQLLEIWARTRATVLFVTHSIDEAVLLADRIVVMTSRPGRIAEIVAVGLARPRTGAMRAEPVFQALALYIRRALGVDGGAADVPRAP